MQDGKHDPHSSDRPSMRPFLVIWTGQAFSLVGSALVQFALVWWLTATSGSATVLALATLMEVLPRVFVSPLAGALVDRWRRRTVLIVADGLIALALVMLGVLYVLGVVQVWHIYVLLFLRAVGGAFHWPAMQASTTLMVPDQHLGRVAGMNQTLHGLVNIVAPVLGAFLFELLPMQAILAIDVGTALLAIVPLLLIGVPQPAPRAGAQPGDARPSVLADLRAGLRFVRDWPGMVTILAIAAVSNLLANPAFALVPLLVSAHFSGGAIELGWLQAAFGIGVIVGGLVLSAWGGFRRRILTASLASVLSGLGFVLLGALPPGAILVAVGAAFVVGFASPIVNGSMMAMFQSIVPPEMQGRIFTLILSITGVTTPIGLAIAGPVGDALGVPVWFLLSGILTSLMAVVQLFVPSVMRIEDHRGGSETALDTVPIDQTVER